MWDAPSPASRDEDEPTDVDDEDGHEELPEEEVSTHCPSCGAEVLFGH